MLGQPVGLWPLAGLVLSYPEFKPLATLYTDRLYTVHFFLLKGMLHATICKDDSQRNTSSQCWNNVATIRNSNVIELCCARTRCCESSRVT